MGDPIPFYERHFDGRFQFPFSAVVSGPSLSGKTQWLTTFLDRTQDFISEKIHTVVWFYDSKTPALDILESKYNASWFKCVQGLPDINHLEQYLTRGHNSIFILDDLAQDAGDSSLIAKLLYNYVHHKNIGVFLVLQDLFSPGKYRASFLKSIHYLILFRNPLNNTVLSIVGQ
jgi:hypothetical protein